MKNFFIIMIFVAKIKGLLNWDNWSWLQAIINFLSSEILCSFSELKIIRAKAKAKTNICFSLNIILFFLFVAAARSEQQQKWLEVKLRISLRWAYLDSGFCLANKKHHLLYKTLLRTQVIPFWGFLDKEKVICKQKCVATSL